MSDRRPQWLLFTISTFIAVLLWLQVQPIYDPLVEREFSVPVSLVNLQDELVVVSAPRVVQVIASGTATQLDRLETDRVSAVLDLGEATPATTELELELSTPAGSPVRFSLKRPRQPVTLEAVLSREFPVMIEYSGTPVSGFEVTAASLLPERVQVLAPRTQLEQVQRVRAVLDLSRVRPGATVEARVEVLDADNKPLSLARTTPDTVTISPAVAVAEARKTVLVNPDFEGEPPPGISLVDYTLRPPQVVLEGSSAVLAGLTTVDTEPISLTGIRQNRTSTVQLRLPVGVRSEDDRVEIVIRVRRLR